MTTPTRDRLVQAMGASMQRRGMNATGLNDVLREANAPKGVLYHHFPGGKSALAVAAVDESVELLVSKLERALDRGDDLFEALTGWVERAADALRTTEFSTGCPLATVALETTPADTEIRAAIDRGFDRLREVIAHGLVRDGRSASDAERMAFTIIATYEGGLLQARVSGQIEPMVESCRFVLDLMRARA